MSKSFVRSWGTVKQLLIATLLLLSGALFLSWNREYVNFQWNVENSKTRSDALLRHVRNTCTTMRFPNKMTNRAINHMVYDDERKVIYCFIPKVASTSWKRVFVLLTRHPKQNVSTMTRHAVHGTLPFLSSDKNKEEKLRTYKKFMVVRHPFERVLSAYRDKLEDWEPADSAFPRMVKGRIGKYRMSAFFGRNWSTVKQLLGAILLLLSAALLVSWSMECETSVVEAEDAKTRSDALEQHVKEVCKTMRFPDTGASQALDHMHYDDVRKVIYCFIPKVASTSWKKMWLKMTQPRRNVSAMRRGAIHISLPLLILDKDKEKKLKTYKKFMVVRHPFERVLSAYRDKLEYWARHNHLFHLMVGKELNKYRNNPNKKEGDNITFTKYIRFISQPGRGTPEQRNEHWLPMHEICHPCAIQYDFIGKYENLKEDSEYLMKWLGVTDLMDTFPAATRPFHASRYDPKYFGQLSHEEIMAFHAKYLPDFLLFDYGFM
ncbi:carbohydrate sulfotransferase 11-like isoform X1 [Scylla paramamosain]|uniref:carbohydrate sulfotransferase 11-like isoform X1 n=1 Tax=Scylla paramamosain TaxID=85552 RepID=UPI003083BBF4